MKQESTPTNGAKRFARLAAVQALYQSNFGQQPVGEIVRASIADEFSTLRGQDLIVGEDLPDAGLFRAIVEGVASDTNALDEMIAGSLDPRFSVKRLEILLITVMRAGAYELYRHSDIPVGIIINDYIDVSKVFFNGKEINLVNGMLDKLAGTVRALSSLPPHNPDGLA